MAHLLAVCGPDLPALYYYLWPNQLRTSNLRRLRLSGVGQCGWLVHCRLFHYHDPGNGHLSAIFNFRQSTAGQYKFILLNSFFSIVLFQFILYLNLIICALLVAVSHTHHSLEGSTASFVLGKWASSGFHSCVLNRHG